METIRHSHCCYCRRKFSDTDFNLKRTKDHFIALSRSGNAIGENIIHACHECNTWKADRTPEMWLGRVEYYQKRNKKMGTYKQIDYAQIIGSIRHWMKHFKHKKVSEYKF